MEYDEPPGKFCERCGRVLEKMHLEPELEEEKKKCLKCGHQNPMENKVCDNCGDLLHTPWLG